MGITIHDDAVPLRVDETAHPIEILLDSGETDPGNLSIDGRIRDPGTARGVEYGGDNVIRM